MGEYDRSSKWLIQHHGDSILKLAGVGDVVSWRALQSEVVQPGQLPDGVIEVQHTDCDEHTWYVVEIATYPERRVQDQLLRDALLVFLDRRVVSEVVALVLHPKGAYQPPDTLTLQSARGWTELTVRWRIVELWTLGRRAPRHERSRTDAVGAANRNQRSSGTGLRAVSKHHRAVWTGG